MAVLTDWKSMWLTVNLFQPGKKAIDLIVDFLSCMWEYAKEEITRTIGAVADLGMNRHLVSVIIARL